MDYPDAQEIDMGAASKWSSWVGCLFRILRGLLNNNAWKNEAQGRFLIADIAGMGSTFDAFTVEKGDLGQTVRLLSNWLFWM